MPQPEDNIKHVCFNFLDKKEEYEDKRENAGRRNSDGFCEAHIESEAAIKEYMIYSEKRDGEQNQYMEKLDKRISSVDGKVDVVDGKVDKLREDMPDIISTSLVNIFKTKLSNGLSVTARWFFKALLVGLAGGIAWFVIELFKHWAAAQVIIDAISTTT